jgi:uncharacterized protein YjiS (DUF1127 family)
MLDVLKPVGHSFDLETKAVRHVAAQVSKKIVHALLWPMRAIEARRLLNQLGALSDSELIDIGLYRSDVANAAAGPADSDPSLSLVRARNERLRARDCAREAWRDHS